MKKQYIWILVIFFMFVGPGPVVFFLNKYTVSLLPISSLIVTLWLLREEIAEASWDKLLRDRSIHKWAFEGLKYAIFAHAITTILLKPKIDLPEATLLGSYLIAPFFMITAGPIMEEIAYRKIIFGALNKRFNFWVGSIVSSAIFAAGHFSLDRLPAYFAVGMIFCYVYKRSGSIVSSMLAHTSLNMIAIIVMTLRG